MLAIFCFSLQVPLSCICLSGVSSRPDVTFMVDGVKNQFLCSVSFSAGLSVSLPLCVCLRVCGGLRSCVCVCSACGVRVFVRVCV